jgi:outer membrane immunogenic protein
MKKFFLGALASIAVAAIAPAQAADMPVKAMPKKAPIVVDPGWTGFYVGGNVGYSWGNWDATGVVIGPTGGHNFNVNGIIGGVQAGFNWQFNRDWLIGIEGDYQWSGEKDDFSWVFPITINDARSGFTIKNEMKFPWFATLRARLGYIPDPNWLVYLTGGLAVGRVEDTASLSLGAISLSISDATTKSGWTIGGGVEAKLGNSNHWSAKAEYLYIDLGTVDFFTNSVAIKVRDHIARVGLNYKF